MARETELFFQRFLFTDSRRIVYLLFYRLIYLYFKFYFQIKNNLHKKVHKYLI